MDLTEDCVPRGIHIDNLCKHMFVCGTPGAGKTTALLCMLIQLFGRGVHFLVIEAAKTEYRLGKTLCSCNEPVVKALARALQIYTPGVERLCPIRFNPLRRPPAVDLDEHIDQLLRCFKASMPMFEPLPALLAEALELVYEEHPDQDDPPIMDDLFDAAQRVLMDKGYSPIVESDLLAALEVRLGMLSRRTVGRALRGIACTPDIAQLVTSYSIIELDPLESEVKCLLTLFLLTAIHQYIRAHVQTEAIPGAGPRLVIVIEEAHNIVGRSTDSRAGDNRADPQACTTELICRMLAEFRALGVGLILVDQFPSLMAPQVIKSTGAKMAFRQVDREDREALADTMLFGDLEYEEIARLLPGQAFLFAEGYHRAHRIRTPDISKLLNLSRPPETDLLASLMRDETWFQEAAIRRTADVLLRFRSGSDRCRRQLERACNQVAGLLQRRTALARIADAAHRLEMCRELATVLRRTGERITAAFERLQRGPYIEARALVIPSGQHSGQLETLRQSQLQGFDEVIEPQARRLKDLVDRSVAQLRRGVFQEEA